MVFTKLKYASGSMIKVYENFSGFYLIFYLTAVVGMQAGVAGTIQSAIGIFGAFMCPLMGNYIGRKGIKRKTIKVMFIPAALIPCLLFSNFGFSGICGLLFYIVVGCLMILCYDSTMLAFEALGAELVTDASERASLRGMNAAFVYIGVIFGCTIAYASVGCLQSKGISTELSWTISIALFVSLVMAFAGVMMLYSTKSIKKEKITSEHGGEINFFHNFADFFKEKNFVGLLCFEGFYGIANALSGTMILYFATYNLGISEAKSGMLYTVSAIAIIISVPIINKLNRTVEMKKTMVIGVGVFAMLCVAVKLTGADTYLHACIMCAGFSFMNAAQLAVSYAMIYNIGEVHEFKTGRQEVVGFLGVFNFAIGIVGALGSFLLGLVLQLAGFVSGGDIQKLQVQSVIETLFVVVPPVCAVVSLLFLSMYKINNRNHAAITKALELKRQGREYSTQGFEELL